MSKIIQISSTSQKQDVIEYLKSETYPSGLNKDQKKAFRSKALKFLLDNEQLCFRKGENSFVRTVFDFENKLAGMILNEEHRTGHPGMTKMIDKIHRKYYGISSNRIIEFVRNCDACMQSNNLTTIQDIQVNEITHKYERYIMDCVDLRMYSELNEGYSWILNVIDTYTKYLFSFKLKNKTAESVKDSLKHIYLNYGVPLTIQADNGKEFKNRLLCQFHSSLNIQWCPKLSR